MDTSLKSSSQPTEQFEGVSGGPGGGQVGQKDLFSLKNSDVILGGAIISCIVIAGATAATLFQMRNRKGRKKIVEGVSEISLPTQKLAKLESFTKKLTEANLDLAKKIENGEIIKTDKFNLGVFNIYLTPSVLGLLQSQENSETIFNYLERIQDCLNDVDKKEIFTKTYNFTIDIQATKFDENDAIVETILHSPLIKVIGTIATSPNFSIIIDSEGEDGYKQIPKGKPNLDPNNRP